VADLNVSSTQMSITECPHCYRKVVPSQAGECPSCGKNVGVAPSSGNRKRLLVIRGGESLPNICFSCAGSAHRFVIVKISNVDAATSLRRSLFSILVPLGRLFTAFDSAKSDRFLSVKLPVCDNCRRRKVKPEVQSFDLESREVRVIVHEQFLDSVSRK
jgi:hypothetical protein